MKLVFSRQGKSKPSEEMAALLRQAVKLSLLRMKADQKVEVSLTLTDDPGIRELNKAYRNMDRPTDVLSFPINEGQALATGGNQRRLLGDIIISTDRAADQALAYGHSYEREMAFLTVHGMLHLLGLDHQRPEEAAHMEELQRQILRAMGLPR